MGTPSALQATPPDGAVVINTVLNPWGQCEVSFRDTVRGIDSTTLEMVFEPYMNGTGLGLAITKKIIESHSETLMVQSEIGSGTTVTVRLPIKATANGGMT